jgi:hypothetical protein
MSARSAGYGGRNASTYGGRLPATVGIAGPAPPPEPRAVVAAGFGARNATTYAGRKPARIGFNAEPSVGELLNSVSGFALVLDTGNERALYAAADSPNRGLTALDVTMEANALASWSASLPADRELFTFAFADVVIGHDGNRLFHGQLLPAKGTRSDNEVSVSGHGRLFELTSGGMEFSCSNCTGWQALNQLWQQIAEWTDGRVRGFAQRPPSGEERMIGDEPFEASGTPMQVLKTVSGEFGFLFTMDHAERAPVVESFRPGTQTREAVWDRTDHSVELDPTKYHNRVIVRGAQQADGSGRYRGEAIAPAEEIETLTNGQLVTHKPAPNDDLTSNQACQARAQSLLDELRGQYSISGSVDATPVGVVPGYTYQVPAFNNAVPEPARPARAPLRKVTHTLIGGAKTQLDFSTERGIVQAIRRAQNPDLAPASIQRQQPGLGMDETGGEAFAPVYNSAYPHPYGDS